MEDSKQILMDGADLCTSTFVSYHRVEQVMGTTHVMSVSLTRGFDTSLDVQVGC